MLVSMRARNWSAQDEWHVMDFPYNVSWISVNPFKSYYVQEIKHSFSRHDLISITNYLQPFPSRSVSMKRTIKCCEMENFSLQAYAFQVHGYNFGNQLKIQNVQFKSRSFPQRKEYNTFCYSLISWLYRFRFHITNTKVHFIWIFPNDWLLTSFSAPMLCEGNEISKRRTYTSAWMVYLCLWPNF